MKDLNSRLLITVFIQGVPTSKSSDGSSAWMDRITEAFSARWTDAPLKGPLRIESDFMFPRRLMTSRRTLWKHSNPDLDNCMKAVNDAITRARVWCDDGQVSESFERKRYALPGEEVGVTISIFRLDSVSYPIPIKNP